ncbi:hypothetical protein GUITHDRAFT_155491 [Guillardia theta CCMP2712]|uniref:t-SNARE coiled-coil homology domain-containing protein n=3 Tax=Guillardia theta TaxID=55529 RepID=L1II27_GUITC|nr:hypothetical protein GUITHDRAFT_155491 [Guillardia theta CCMP2712]EKX35465.1 hypothetical protein GUITHDRAFT_155491 [Guillardia theta CCMP2712]|eukprot:XP_005822445.1 hypothetical protein GUITHDRAFT_155491 [Guillardia theta CCMP2712]
MSTPKQSQRSPMTESMSPPAQIMSFSTHQSKEGSQQSQGQDSSKLDELLAIQKKQQENVDVVLRRMLELELHMNQNHLAMQENLKNQGKMLNSHTDQIQRLSAEVHKKSCCVIS